MTSQRSQARNRLARAGILALVAIAMVLAMLLSPLAAGTRASGALPQAAGQNSPPGLSALPLKLRQRFDRLDGVAAEPYLLLAEEVADFGQSLPGRDARDVRWLARQLYVLAATLDSAASASAAAKASGPTDGKARPASAAAITPRGQVARAACFGLAELTPLKQERRWLLALARLSAAADGRVGGERLIDEPITWTTAILLTDAISLARAGEGRRADALLKKLGVDQLLLRYEGALDEGAAVGTAGKLRRWIADWPVCPECQNRRVVNKPEGGKAVMRACPRCGGNPGPELTTDELIGQVRFQATLLSGISDSWSAAILADGGQPLREVDLQELAARFGVDPELRVLRSGVWSKP